MEMTLKISKRERERNRLRVKKWREDNPYKYKEHLEYVKEWRRNNKERARQVQKDWYQRNRYWLLEYYKQHYYDNKKKESVKKSTKNVSISDRGKRKNANK